MRNRKSLYFAPPGHFYSPIPDLTELPPEDRTFAELETDVSMSISLNSEQQRKLVAQLARYSGEFCWGMEIDPGMRFHFKQEWFREGDAIILYAMLRHFRPKRVIEVGSGFSSALMLDTNDKFLNGEIEFTFIEPYPDRLMGILRAEDSAHSIIEAPVQQVDRNRFSELQAGDMLFVDSSHVSKAGSDVNYLIFDIVPSLKEGVLIHFHDIFWPFEYPREWLARGVAWNENYLIRAFLQYNTSIEMLLLNSYIGQKESAWLEKNLPIFLANTGGSMWLRKREDARDVA